MAAQLTTFTEAGIEVHEEIVLMTTKGEAIALGIAQMSTVELSSCDHGVVAKVKRCIMERDLYPRRWGLGPTALEKKKMKTDGKLDVRVSPAAFTQARLTATFSFEYFHKLHKMLNFSSIALTANTFSHYRNSVDPTKPPHPNGRTPTKTSTPLSPHPPPLPPLQQPPSPLPQHRNPPPPPMPKTKQCPTQPNLYPQTPQWQHQ